MEEGDEGAPCGTRRDVLENLDPFVRGRLLHPSSSSFRRSSAEGFR